MDNKVRYLQDTMHSIILIKFHQLFLNEYKNPDSMIDKFILLNMFCNIIHKLYNFIFNLSNNHPYKICNLLPSDLCKFYNCLYFSFYYDKLNSINRLHNKIIHNDNFKIANLIIHIIYFFN